MAIAASKVKAICSAEEVKLVRASRKGEIEKLNAAEVKKLAAQAKKLSDKWRSLGRSQSRDRNRKVGFGEAAANTELKAQIFRDALDAFEAKSAELEKSSAAPAKQSAKKGKKDRTAEHRAVRAAVRKGMTAVEDLLDVEEQPRKKSAKPAAAKPAAAKPAAAKPAAAKPAAAKPVAVARRQGPLDTPPPPTPVTKQRPSTKPIPTAKRTPQTQVDPFRQQAAIASAKQSRIVRSGKTTRMVGHITARGKRAQARRDSKG